ncbi:MAG TPA: DoxX family protein [Mariniphaga anaerophila]|uniref:DoxX family protein n=1 Tax=Mariniphaga anaerophila TaxID=1484053 RepID=A0A831PK39_9BACT|nr:DoxX family protein [Mariniphaga anaerophila]
MKFIKHFSRIVVGLTFIFSGFVKGIDPWGSAFKFSDYFIAMNLDWLLWATFPLGVLLAFAEFAIGLGLLFNTFHRLAAWLAMLFMVFFTGLTLWIAIENPVTDCGCFGDALVISNWETFYKNLVLIALTFIVFYYRNNMKGAPGKKTGFVLSLLSVIIYAGIVIHSYNHLPIFDFRPYKVGVNIPEAMSIPSDAQQDVYENIFYYKNKNTGEVERFTEENYPWQDTLNYEFHDMESNLLQRGYEPPIHDFTIETQEGDDIIDFFIYDDNYVFILISYDLKKSSTKPLGKINTLANWAMDQGFPFIGLTASLPNEYQIFAEKHHVPFEFFNCDEITLKTIIRANPGLMVLNNGTIVAKYHYNDIPSPEEFEQEFINK